MNQTSVIDEQVDPIPAQSRISWMAEIPNVVTVLLICIGGAALHFWTVYLFFAHYGIFAAIVAFLFPPLSDLIAIILALFVWSSHLYLWAVASWTAILLVIGLFYFLSEIGVWEKSEL